MNQNRLIYTLGLAAIPVISRLWVRYRREKRQKREYQLPLFDAVLLEVALTPREGDDPDVLVEIRETLAHLNRRSFAEEFWTLDQQLAQYYERVPRKSRPTVRRAIARLLEQPDRWLQAVAAKTSARLCFTEATPAIEALLESGDEAQADQEAWERFRDELTRAKEALAGCAAGKERD